MVHAHRWSAAALALLVVVASPHRGAARPREAAFALVLGVNHSLDSSQRPLRYADDDAARYFDLFRALGARVYVLTRPDDNTRRLHAQAAAEARLPRAAELEETVATLADDVDRARQRGVKTVFYFVYAGHGNEAKGARTVTLEDSHLTSERLAVEVLDRVAADRTHLVVDACGSFLFAYTGARGPGGKRRELHGFSAVMPALADRTDVGLLLSTSSARDSHEWEAVQAGVFSHIVRSGLYGAADVDDDGLVSYPEIAAFVERAGAAIPNERYRPEVHVRAPGGSERLLDLRQGLERRLEIDGETTHGHFYVEDALGVRLLDFHNAEGQPVRLVRSPASGLLYLRDDRAEAEFEIPAAPPVVRLADVAPRPPRAEPRGAAHHAFRQLFALPFGREAVESWAERPARETLLWSHDAYLEEDPDDAYRLRLGLAYELRNAYLEDAALMHGLRLQVAYRWGRWDIGGALGYAGAAYEWSGAVDVRAHEATLTAFVRFTLWRVSVLRLRAGLELGGAWTFQRGTLPDGARQDRDGPVGRYRGGLGLAIDVAPRVALHVWGLVGQAIYETTGGVRAPFEGALLSGFTVGL